MASEAATNFIRDLYTKYGLKQTHIYKAEKQKYVIINRFGIEIIQAKANIDVDYEVIQCEPEFACVKATAKKGNKTVTTFGSALKTEKGMIKNKKGEEYEGIVRGNTETWYIMEIAEKRALSRAVLKIEGLYAQGAFGEDESEEFEPKSEENKNKSSNTIKSIIDGK